MSLHHEEASELFSAGAFSQLIRRTEQPHGDHDQRCQVVLAHALAHAGELDRAHLLATRCDLRNTPISIRRRAKLVLGLTSERRGDRLNAIRHYNDAIQLATTISDAEGAAWPSLHLFRLRSECDSLQVVTAAMNDLRRLVVKAAKPQVTCYFHICVAMLEGQTGHVDEVQRHCDVAESLLALSPNMWLQSGILLNRGCAALLSCDFAKAFEYLKAAKEVTAVSGQGLVSLRVDGNLGHIQFVRGDFEGARTTLEQAADGRKGDLITLGALDTLARIKLAT